MSAVSAPEPKLESYLGLMSGTSQDGIDAVLAEFHDGRFQRTLARHTGHYAPELRCELLELSRESTPVTLARYAELDRKVADAFADTALALLESLGAQKPDVRALGSVTAIGSHGQTVFHDPAGAGNSLQLGDPSRIAVRTGLTVVADLRRADLALGGQGAPLLPAFHHALFASGREARAVLNLGGIANLSLLPGLHPDLVRGFDCGPASCLMDEWTERHQGLTFDADGAWAAQGQLQTGLLDALLDDPYYLLPPPKSTGRGQFHLRAVEQRVPALLQHAPQDVQRTLCELTARSVAEALLALLPDTRRLIVCGGGVRNGFLMSRLVALLPGLVIETTASHGLDPQLVEASAFAWFAARRLRNEPASLPSVTGASRAAVLGGVYAP